MRLFKRLDSGKDNTLLRDVIFLLISCWFVLIKAFDFNLQEAALLAPVVLVGVSAVLMLAAQLLLAAMKLLDWLGDRLGWRRSPLS